MSMHLVERRARRASLAAGLGSGVGHRQFSDGSVVRRPVLYVGRRSRGIQARLTPGLAVWRSAAICAGVKAREGRPGGGNVAGRVLWWRRHGLGRDAAVRMMLRAAPARAKSSMLVAVVGLVARSSRVGSATVRGADSALGLRRWGGRFGRGLHCCHGDFARRLGSRWRLGVRTGAAGWGTRAPRPGALTSTSATTARGLIRASIAEVPEHQDRAPPCKRCVKAEAEDAAEAKRKAREAGRLVVVLVFDRTERAAWCEAEAVRGGAGSSRRPQVPADRRRSAKAAAGLPRRGRGPRSLRLPRRPSCPRGAASARRARVQ